MANTKTVQLIFDEDFVKGLMPMSQNIAGGYMRSAMLEAQELDLKAILGECLLERLKGVAAAAPLVEDIYTEAIDRCLYFLSYRTMARLVPKVTYKVMNAGAYQVADERTQPLTQAMANALVDEYTNSADAFAYELQGWLLEHARELPELCACDCQRIKSNLVSAASCGIWLGGPRGNL